MSKRINLNSILGLYKPTGEFVAEYFGCTIDAFAVAGSGIFDSFPPEWVINRLPYSQLPLFPNTTIIGHGNEIALINIPDNNHFSDNNYISDDISIDDQNSTPDLNTNKSGFSGKNLAVFTGRFHLYEGHPLSSVIATTLTAYHAGCRKLILTNAAGGLNPLFSTGNIMLINETINFTSRNILADISCNEGRIANYFTDGWRKKIATALTSKGTDFCEGAYLSVTGPNYETGAEIRMFRKMGADAIGMSTIHEAQAAYILGMDLTGCSVITNELTEVHTQMLNHEDVIDAAEKARHRMRAFIEAAVEVL